MALKKGPFDLIISDYSLPSFNGFAALALRQEVAPDVPFVLFSGTIGEEPAVESLKRGATDYVIKQRPERLGPAVRRAIQEVRDRAERRRIEEQLRKQDELFRRITASVEDLIAVLDLDGRRVFNSPSYQPLLGDPRSLVGAASTASRQPEYQERVPRGFARLAHYMATYRPPGQLGQQMESAGDPQALKTDEIFDLLIGGLDNV